MKLIIVTIAPNENNDTNFLGAKIAVGKKNIDIIRSPNPIVKNKKKYL